MMLIFLTVCFYFIFVQQIFHSQSTRVNISITIEMLQLNYTETFLIYTHIQLRYYFEIGNEVKKTPDG